jgi:hypothetical protein
VRSTLENDTAGVDPPQWSQHPLPWRNTLSGGENHLTDANGRRVHDGLDAAEMFRLYAGAAQAPALLDTNRTRRRGSGTGGNGVSVDGPASSVAALPVGGRYIGHGPRWIAAHHPEQLHQASASSARP